MQFTGNSKLLLDDGSSALGQYLSEEESLILRLLHSVQAVSVLDNKNESKGN